MPYARAFNNNNDDPYSNFADITMLQDQIKPAFVNSMTGMPKIVECIRLDGGGEKGQPMLKFNIGGQLGISTTN